MKANIGEDKFIGRKSQSPTPEGVGLSREVVFMINNRKGKKIEESKEFVVLIEEEAELVATLDVKGFKNNLRNMKNSFEKVIKPNLYVKKNNLPESNLLNLKHFLWLGVDWNYILSNLSAFKDEITLSVFEVKLINLTTYDPDYLSDGHKLSYKPVVKSFDEYLFLINDSKDKNHLNRCVERLLSTKTVNYLEVPWKIKWGA